VNTDGGANGQKPNGGAPLRAPPFCFAYTLGAPRGTKDRTSEAIPAARSLLALRRRGRLSLWVGNEVLSVNNVYLVVLIAALLAGCATASSGVGQVKEIEPGTYKIGVGAAGNSVLIGGNDASNAAVEQAGQYCRTKGQKLVIVPTPGRDVTFRCGDAVKPGE
jgi:predicted small secreted protein